MEREFSVSAAAVICGASGVVVARKRPATNKANARRPKNRRADAANKGLSSFVIPILHFTINLPRALFGSKKFGFSKGLLWVKNYVLNHSIVFVMKARLTSAYGYQGDAMNLACADVEKATLFYVEKMGFDVVEQDSGPGEPPNEDAIKRVVLERDGIRMALAENGGDPEQDGCAFHADNVEALRDEFIHNGLEKIGEIKDETRENGKFKVFFVVAPDGLCYWFGEKQ